MVRAMQGPVSVVRCIVRMAYKGQRGASVHTRFQVSFSVLLGYFLGAVLRNPALVSAL